MMTKKKLAGLLYVGSGYLPGVPARDLEAAEVEEWGEWYLLQSKLYRRAKAHELEPDPIEDETIEGEASWESQD